MGFSLQLIAEAYSYTNSMANSDSNQNLNSDTNSMANSDQDIYPDTNAHAIPNSYSYVRTYYGGSGYSSSKTLLRCI